MSGILGLIGQMGGAAVGQVVKDAGSAIGGLAKDLRAAITGDEVASEETKIKLAEIADRLESREQELATAQIEVNKLEAQNPSLFVSGWRPSIGWICSASLGAYFIPKYTLAAIFWTRLSWKTGIMQPYPVDGDDLMQLVFALLGMATLRTYESVKQVKRVK